MTLDPQASILHVLRDAGIVSPAQYRRALADPRFGELAGHSDPAEYLVWLVCRDIMSEQQLRQASARIAATSTGDELEVHEETIVSALRMLESVRESLNKQWFDELVAENLITPAERDLGLEHLSAENVLASPAAALAWMALSEVISGSRLSDAAIRAAPAGTRQADILAEASDIHTKTRAGVRNAIIGAIFPGPRWLWIGTPVLVVAFMIWLAVKPATVPKCTDSDIARSVNNMVLRASIDARVANPLAALNQSPPTPRVHDIKEVGFAAETGIRGCIATLKADEEQIPYAFTIAPSQREKDEYTVTGAEPAIVRARFGRLDADGAFLNKAEPIGRAEVERAFRSGADSVSMGRTPGRQQRDPGNALSTIAPERNREIAEVEPMGPCREIKKGTVYSCPLLIERNDALLAVIGGGSSMLIDSSFTFERDSATAPWRVSAAFSEEYMRAVAAARMKAVGHQQEAQ